MTSRDSITVALSGAGSKHRVLDMDAEESLAVHHSGFLVLIDGVLSCAVEIAPEALQAVAVP
jgi:hypothetical protein